MATVTVATLKPLAEGVIVSATSVGTAVTIYANAAGEDCTVTQITAYNQHTDSIQTFKHFFITHSPSFGSYTVYSVYVQFSSLTNLADFFFLTTVFFSNTFRLSVLNASTLRYACLARSRTHGIASVMGSPE